MRRLCVVKLFFIGEKVLQKKSQHFIQNHGVQNLNIWFQQKIYKKKLMSKFMKNVFVWERSQPTSTSMVCTLNLQCFSTILTYDNVLIKKTCILENLPTIVKSRKHLFEFDKKVLIFFGVTKTIYPLNFLIRITK